MWWGEMRRRVSEFDEARGLGGLLRVHSGIASGLAIAGDISGPLIREFTVMALRGVVAQRGGLIRPSTWGKLKTITQFAAILLAFVRLSEPWGPWYLDQWVMLAAVIATIGSMWGYLAAFWDVVKTEPSEVKA